MLKKLISLGAVVMTSVCPLSSSAPAATQDEQHGHGVLACVGPGRECHSSSQCCGTMMCKLGSHTTKQYCTRIH